MIPEHLRGHQARDIWLPSVIAETVGGITDGEESPDGCQRIVPYLTYDDPVAALEYLCRVFGFEERLRMAADDGTVMHAEVGMDNDVVMIGGGYEEMGLRGRKSLAAGHSFVVCYVDDVDAHFARAKAEGGRVISEPEDQFYGDRSYRVADLEDNLWMFQTHVRDVDLENMSLEDMTP